MTTRHLALALRSASRHPLHAALTVAVLTLGLAAWLVGYLFAHNVDGYDRQWAGSDRILTLDQRSTHPRSPAPASFEARTALGVAAQVRFDVPELTAVARYVAFESPVSVDGGPPDDSAVAYAEPQWQDMFGMRAVAGDAAGALKNLRTALVTVDFATRKFGSATAAVGKTVTIADEAPTEVTIAAVLAPIEGASQFKPGILSLGFDVLASWDTFEHAYTRYGQANWLSQIATTLVQLPADGSLTVTDVDRRLADFGERYVPKQQGTIELQARPVSTFASSLIETRLRGVGGPPLPMPITRVALLLGFGVLAIGCVNFVNLTTARSAARAREIGVRKALGATRRGIVGRDLLETSCSVLASLAIALAAIDLTARTATSEWAGLVAVPWTSPPFWASLAALAIAVTLAAGLYPALVLARAKPKVALRLGTLRQPPKALRTALVGVQFASAAFVLAALAIVYQQQGALRERLLGRFDDQYVVLYPAFLRAAGNQAGAALDELARGPGIKGVTASGQAPFATSTPTDEPSSWSRTPGELDSARPLTMELVRHDYFTAMAAHVLAGRVFSRDRPRDPYPASAADAAARTSPVRVVLDRSAARALGWSTPSDAVGELLFSPYAPAEQQGVEIIGVVDDLPLQLRAGPANGTTYLLLPRLAYITYVRVAPGRMQEALAHIDAVWREFVPNAPVSRGFLDKLFEQAYLPFALINRIFAGLALFAVSIAGIGLLGMASYMTGRRTREIGLRKTLGANRRRIVRLLLGEFATPVIAANVVVWPLVIIAGRKYLDVFVTRIDLTPLPLALALAATLAIACAAVGGTVLRAASVRPTEALRDE